jgi:hypothetical protein
MARRKKPSTEDLVALYCKLSSEEQEACCPALMSDPRSLILRELARLTERQITLRYIVEDAEEEARQALIKRNKGRRSNPRTLRRDALVHWRHYCDGRSLGEIALDFGVSDSHVAHMISRHTKRHNLVRPVPRHASTARH